MRQIVRFWVLILSVTVASVAFGHLFLSFLSFLAPGVSLVASSTNERLLVTGVALASLATFIWAFSFAGTPEPEGRPGKGEGEDSGGPTLGNRNR